MKRLVGAFTPAFFLLAWVSVECRRAHPADSDRTLAEGENVVDAACQMHRIRDEASYFTTKDYEFDRPTMETRRAQGYSDALETLKVAPWLEPTPIEVGARTFDVCKSGFG